MEGLPTVNFTSNGKCDSNYLGTVATTAINRTIESLASVAPDFGAYATDAKASSLAMFGFMISWVETGPSAVFGVASVKWVLDLVKASNNRSNHDD